MRSNSLDSRILLRVSSAREVSKNHVGRRNETVYGVTGLQRMSDGTPGGDFGRKEGCFSFELPREFSFRNNERRKNDRSARRARRRRQGRRGVVVVLQFACCSPAGGRGGLGEVLMRKRSRTRNWSVASLTVTGGHIRRTMGRVIL